MSNKIINQTWGIDGLSLGARLILLYLADRADKDGVCYPSVDTIAKNSKLSRSQVFRCLTRLRDEGFISITSGKGRGVRSVYIVHPKGRTYDTISSEEKVASVLEKGRNRISKRSHGATPPYISEESSVKNPQKESSVDPNIDWLEKRYLKKRVTA